MKPARFDYLRPADLPAALTALRDDAGAKPVSGGQSLGPMLNLRLARPSLLVHVGALPELRAVEEGPDAIFYGAAITHAEFEDGVVPDATPGFLARIAGGIAYRAVRNRGTMGGSLAHADPAADWPTTLAALGARVRLARVAAHTGHQAGHTGLTGHLTALIEPREIPVEDFITGAFETALGEGEVVTGVIVPRCHDTARFGYRKSCRKVGEFAEAMCAVLYDPARGVFRLAIGATEARQLVIQDARFILQDIEKIDEVLHEAGLADNPASFRLRRAVIRQAIAALEPESLSA
ncbi:FAD binding domain-containing protein [Ancylobacter sp. SL191]|uniref:FAD binding domain-containing protein n=1 Tax=Ancylobacter sp. SL191 TaxID=2995166 RepID=UPI0022704A24|nr:FAD binding domain-containing protein [Ancylobacter sp. SL191]WAC26926.1 FAD binding domain-containing protein [Ancylobacter sp. SL191]